MSMTDPAPNGFSWPNGAKLALSIVVNVEEGAERGLLQGDKANEPVDELVTGLKAPIRVHGNESNYQYGINRGAPRILRALNDAGVKASWTVCAQALEKAPWLANEISSRGDEPVSHGYRWLFTAFMDEAKEAAFVQKGTDSILATTGRKPVGYLSRYLHTDHLRKTLAKQGYLYHMDDFSDDFPRWESFDDGTPPIIVLPYAVDSNDMKFWLSPSFTAEMWLSYAKRTFDELLEEASSEGARMMSLGLHLRIIGRPGRIWAFKVFLEYVKDRSDVWIATREDIANHFAKHVKPE
ncbi:peptidoglycan/xylan/chitin deacetylase (PgdA/CDA1 family) [Litorimonas taeanensis]|uniref:Chitooligosaccharide deacetylase n=1 Tax=Litorimonas taeanensis TaxID=568099 RepID=A0A420WLQ1_9PROT|nr:polysaccharide deacetylase family protein [Litorimonas taeanensis]RKQ71947.1 peptidoglycan/xylan/chitin deacetylase (PgdA/CDA1 family) [Litorimonas taeanensis]